LAKIGTFLGILANSWQIIWQIPCQDGLPHLIGLSGIYLLPEVLPKFLPFWTKIIFCTKSPQS
jgi:hypothetical protein